MFPVNVEPAPAWADLRVPRNFLADSVDFERTPSSTP